MLNFLSQKPFVGAIAGLGAFFSSVTLTGALGVVGILLGIAISGITLLIKWREIGGWKGTLEVIRNWKTGHE